MTRLLSTLAERAAWFCCATAMTASTRCLATSREAFGAGRFEVALLLIRRANRWRVLGDTCAAAALWVTGFDRASALALASHRGEGP